MNDEKLQTFKSLTFGTELEYEQISRRRLAEAIQSVPDTAVQDAWGVTIANGSVTAVSAGN